jgi:hypothetical protein
MVASQELAGGESILWCAGGCVDELNLLPTMGSDLHPSHQRL